MQIDGERVFVGRRRLRLALDCYGTGPIQRGLKIFGRVVLERGKRIVALFRRFALYPVRQIVQCVRHTLGADLCRGQNICPGRLVQSADLVQRADPHGVADGLAFLVFALDAAV